jgi:DNA-binding transcriptional regulator YhcF (GntR family)
MVRSKGPLHTNTTYHFSKTRSAGEQHLRTRSNGVKERRRSWGSLYAWQLNRRGEAPLFRQLYLQIRSAILSQSLRPGAKLPSTRELASQLSVSRSAVVAAYEQLLAEGYATGKIGSGSYVSIDLPEPVERAEPCARQAVRSAGSIGYSPDACVQRLRRRHRAERRPPLQPRPHTRRWQDHGAVAKDKRTGISFARPRSLRLFRSAGACPSCARQSAITCAPRAPFAAIRSRSW